MGNHCIHNIILLLLFFSAGDNVQLNSCSGADNQRWMLNKKTGEITGLQSGLCLDVGSYASCKEDPWSHYPYCNIELDPLTRAQDLVGRMVPAEMVRTCTLLLLYKLLFNHLV